MVASGRGPSVKRCKRSSTSAGTGTSLSLSVGHPCASDEHGTRCLDALWLELCEGGVWEGCKGVEGVRQE
jgi:hypothetical protein